MGTVITITLSLGIGLLCYTGIRRAIVNAKKGTCSGCQSDCSSGKCKSIE